MLQGGKHRRSLYFLHYRLSPIYFTVSDSDLFYSLWFNNNHCSTLAREVTTVSVENYSDCSDSPLANKILTRTVQMNQNVLISMKYWYSRKNSPASVSMRGHTRAFRGVSVRTLVRTHAHIHADTYTRTGTHIHTLGAKVAHKSQCADRKRGVKTSHRYSLPS